MKISENLFPLTFFVSLIILYFFSEVALFKGTSIVCTQVSLTIRILAFIGLSCVLLFWGLKTSLAQLSAGLILSGGYLIITELFIRGCVNDYWSFLGFFRFNLSDLFIFVGTLIYLFDLLLKKRLAVMYNQLVNNSERS
jgi:lipoprotein signal peptidase